jgi:hypothetical protein
MGLVWRRALYTYSSHVYVGYGRIVTDDQLEGEAWYRLDDKLLAWRRALCTRSTPFEVGGGRSSAAPDTHKPRYSLM